ncbi:MAG: hypothetical protein JO083_09570 [Candidatus Eremiobacteraeota bacterium]|nr:hypothetical protein [Candidatus Eremiobacteraeota bacterium]
MFALAAAVGLVLAAQTVVPLHVERGPRGAPRLGIDVTVGNRPVRLMLSTSTSGMRVLAGALAPGAAERTGTMADGAFASGLVLHGEQARVQLALPGTVGPASTLVELIDSLSCVDQRHDCPAANGRPPEIFGALFAGMFGIGNVDPPAGACCQNPLNALEAYRPRYIVHAALDAPSLTLDPGDAALQRFTMIDVTGAQTPVGCVRFAGGVTSKVCGEMLFDTGTPYLTVVTTGAIIPTPLPPGTTASLTVGTWSHTYAIGPDAQLHLVMRRGPQNRIVVGLAALQSVDLFYDLPTERIGLRSLDAGVAPAAKHPPPIPVLHGRWSCSSSEWPYTKYDFAFSADGTGKRSAHGERAGGAGTDRFTYFQLDDSDLVTKMRGSAWSRMRFAVHDDALDLQDAGYWHESHWTAYPGEETYRCSRALVTSSQL